jgi:predicted ATPase
MVENKKPTSRMCEAGFGFLNRSSDATQTARAIARAHHAHRHGTLVRHGRLLPAWRISALDIVKNYSITWQACQQLFRIKFDDWNRPWYNSSIIYQDVIEMVYLDSIVFPDEDAEWAFRMSVKRTCYNTLYPFYTLSQMGLTRLDFDPITILCGGNGSGKTTALNIIAEKLRVQRTAPFNRSNFFTDYVNLCNVRLEEAIPPQSRIVTSDDVFDYMLNIRSLNEGIDRNKEMLFDAHYEARHSTFQIRSLEDYEELKKRNSARGKTQSAFVREQLMDNVREQSNGESASFYFKQQIEADALYLLDEPENSLSAAKQQELAEYLEESVRYMGCQLIISTHSPFLLAMKHVKIYDLDARPVDIKKWTQIKNVRVYHDLFSKHSEAFE